MKILSAYSDTESFIDKKIDTNLYFKWIEFISNFKKEIDNDSQIKNIFKISTKGKEILLIDDQAENGWNDVLEKGIFKNHNITAVTVKDDAEAKVKEFKYDLILLDLRLNNEDDKELKPENLSGFKLLQKIREDFFTSKNFSTPVVIFTASNKAWNIDEVLENGADGFYIKENPNFSDWNTSKENYKTFKKLLSRLCLIIEKDVDSGKSIYTLSQKRGEVKKLIDKIHKANYRIKNENIRKRIDEKLKLGYGQLFDKTSKFKQDHFLHNNEILSFLIFWSILEEISAEYYNKQSFKLKKNKDGCYSFNNWCLGEKKVVWETSNLNSNTHEYQTLLSKFPKENFEEVIHNDSVIKYHELIINLSNQIKGIIAFYFNSINSSISQEILSSNFKLLNRYRNQIDFTHSSVETILNNSIKDNINNEAYTKNIKMLKFLLDIMPKEKS